MGFFYLFELKVFSIIGTFVLGSFLCLAETPNSKPSPAESEAIHRLHQSPMKSTLFDSGLMLSLIKKSPNFQKILRMYILASGIETDSQSKDHEALLAQFHQACLYFELSDLEESSALENLHSYILDRKKAFFTSTATSFSQFIEDDLTLLWSKNVGRNIVFEWLSQDIRELKAQQKKLDEEESDNEEKSSLIILPSPAQRSGVVTRQSTPAILERGDFVTDRLYLWLEQFQEVQLVVRNQIFDLEKIKFSRALLTGQNELNLDTLINDIVFRATAKDFSENYLLLVSALDNYLNTEHTFIEEDREKLQSLVEEHLVPMAMEFFNLGFHPKMRNVFFRGMSLNFALSMNQLQDDL